jgi:CRP-like cAMP-binding protein
MTPDLSPLLEMLRDAPEAVFEPGQTVIREGGDLHRLYVLAEGEIELVKGHTPVCKISKAGSTFGEMSALLGVKPTASVVATRRCTFKVMDSPADYLSTHAPATLEIARLLAHRVRWLTASYAAEIDDGESVFWRHR